MAKILICSDNHFTRASSVITKAGEKFSTRLENQIESLRWVAEFGYPVIHLGDFFDKDVLNAEEISCLKELKKEVDFTNWTFLQGNHGYAGGYDVMGIFENQVITKPEKRMLGKNTVLWLPFNSTEDVFDAFGPEYDIIFGHIGVEGIPFGAKGFNPDNIASRCKLFLNGHLHNKVEFRPNCWNIGSLTAQNFSDNCTNNEKGVWILDTETLSLEFIVNPYAYNFYKMDSKLAMKYIVPNMKNSCFSVSCTEDEVDALRERFKNAYYLRLNIQRKKETDDSERVTVKAVDYLEKFRESFIQKQGDSPLILEELSEVCR